MTHSVKVTFPMRLNFRIKKFGFTLFFMLSKTQTIEGITSLLPNGLHNPFFDIENCSLEQAENGLGKVQVSYNLPDTYMASDKNESFRAWCFAEVRFTDYLRMQLDLIDNGLLDYNFFWWTVKQCKATLRLSGKRYRPLQQVVSVLKSYSVPIPDTGLRERVVYDSGIEKRGLTIFLGNNGKTIYGDK